MVTRKETKEQDRRHMVTRKGTNEQDKTIHGHKKRDKRTRQDDTWSQEQGQKNKQ
jgi:hypothetical protein